MDSNQKEGVAAVIGFITANIVGITLSLVIPFPLDPLFPTQLLVTIFIICFLITAVGATIVTVVRIRRKSKSPFVPAIGVNIGISCGSGTLFITLSLLTPTSSSIQTFFLILSIYSFILAGFYVGIYLNRRLRK